MTGASASSAWRALDHRRQRLVLDLDQLQRVAGAVAVVRHDERDLLALEAHLVRGQHGLHVARQRRHPGELQALQVLAGDDGVHLRVLQGGGRVDRDDAGVRERAAQHRAVQHPGQRDVVDVGALAADEARVLLALAAGRSRWGRSSVADIVRPLGLGARGRLVLGRPADRLDDVLIARCSGRSARRWRSRISSSVGSGFAFSSARPVSTIPGVQNPHWRPCSSMNPCCTGSSTPSCSTPSIVVISCPSAIAASTVQDLTGSPSMQHGAGAAVRGVAAPVGAGQAERVAQEVHEQEPRLHLRAALLAVDRDGDLHRVSSSS